ncbi:MAG: 30S ribosomal protein S12 methylthiotransferase RimO [Oscillospiraceae bacterium]|nr:30S ribosomal protein S12 methylthiotransferase RimO [Oscillospiraceae bacterium]
MMNRIGFISLGCPKNQVDSEMMLAKLQESGSFEISDDLYESDIIIINTCAFIEDAKKEAIENILEMAQLKEEGTIQKIIVMGCLAERYKEELQSEIPEIDIIAGLGANGDIVQLCQTVTQGAILQKYPPKADMPIEGARVLTTPSHWAYLKIAEGCSNNCSYCVIPSIRGPFRSREMESVVAEAGQLAGQGVKELILIAQDTTRYGEDLYGELRLPALLRELAKIEGVRWIRLMYCYPERVTDELLEVMASEPKVLNYIDMPVQHADERILRAMNRRGGKESLLALIAKIREKLPDCVLRTTLITGFPGENADEFETLCEFVKEADFDRLGCFAYSPEEGTPAAELPDQIGEETKARRGEIIMEQQFEIFSRKLESKIGQTLPVIVEGYDAYTDSYTGRTWMDAPEIDSTINFTCGYELHDGDIVDAEIINVNEYDLIGEVI